MARSDFGWFRSRPASSRPVSVRMIRSVAAVAAALSAGALPLAAAQRAAAQPATAAGAAGTVRAAAAQASSAVTVNVTSMNPLYGTPGHSVTIAGLVHNNTTAAITGLTVRLLGSRTPLASSSELAGFAGGTYFPSLPQVAGPVYSARRLPAGGSAQWAITVPVNSLGLGCFGVYPLTAEAAASSGPSLASAPVLLPFWPAKQGSCATQRPDPAPISWIWPLIDQPRQGACPALTDSGLAASLKPDGRLGGLLRAAVSYSAQDKLTFAIDPALLENVKTMTAPFTVGGNADCSGATPSPASPDAVSWLASLTKLTKGQPVILTPYADVDVAALTQHGMGADLKRAFARAERVGRAVLPGTFSNSSKTGSGVTASRDATASLLGSLAWPADGVAGYSVLEALAALNVSAVILDGNMMPAEPPLSYIPGAVTTTPNGLGTTMKVLLADHSLTALLGSPQAGSRLRGTIFGVQQLFVAETALNSAEAPSLTRSIVVAPPRHWNPAPQLARGLLAATVSVPWLEPATPSQLVSMRADPAARRALPASSPSSLRLSGRLMRQVSALDGTVGLIESLTPGSPDSELYRALFATESSAWRGKRTSPQAWNLLHQTATYAAGQLGKLSVVGARKVILGGTTGSVLISIHNGMVNQAQVRLQIKVDNTSVAVTQPGPVTVPGGSVKTIKLTVHATQNGQAKVRVTLVSASGTELPVRGLLIQVQATQFGTLTLIICAIALAVFVLASAFRAIRHGRPVPSRPEPGSGGQVPSVSGPGEGAAAAPDQRDHVSGPDTVEPGRPSLSAAGTMGFDHGTYPLGHQPTEGSQ